MRHETCLTCKVPGLIGEEQRLMMAMTESLGPFTHHHHTVRCGLCGGWWFDDLKRGAFGPLQAVRRDTEMCACPDGRPVYTQVAVQIPQPEAECACTRASIEAVPVGSEAYPVDVALARLTDQDQLPVRKKRPAYRQIGCLARAASRKVTAAAKVAP